MGDSQKANLSPMGDKPGGESCPGAEARSAPLGQAWDPSVIIAYLARGHLLWQVRAALPRARRRQVPAERSRSRTRVLMRAAAAAGRRRIVIATRPSTARAAGEGAGIPGPGAGRVGSVPHCLSSGLACGHRSGSCGRSGPFSGVMPASPLLRIAVLRDRPKGNMHRCPPWGTNPGPRDVPHGGQTSGARGCPRR